MGRGIINNYNISQIQGIGEMPRYTFTVHAISNKQKFLF